MVVKLDFLGITIQDRKIAIVDGINVPALYNGSQFTALNDAPSDVTGAEFVVSFKTIYSLVKIIY